GELIAVLPGMIDDALARQSSRPVPLQPDGPFAIETQRRLGLDLMKRLGFDFELGLPAQWSRQPVGDARGMSLHESQSLLIEMQVCRGREFMAFAAPLIRVAFNGAGPAWDAGNLYRLGTRVARSFIRVDADELTYPAHVMLRYRLERALIAGDMRLADLPAAWNKGMRDLIGVEPPDDARGCLQDIHWYDGAWGYFPTYTLGAMNAAQLFQAAKAADSSILPG